MRVAEDARYGVAASVDEQAGTITLRADMVTGWTLVAGDLPLLAGRERTIGFAEARAIAWTELSLRDPSGATQPIADADLTGELFDVIGADTPARFFERVQLNHLRVRSPFLLELGARQAFTRFADDFEVRAAALTVMAHRLLERPVESLVRADEEQIAWIVNHAEQVVADGERLIADGGDDPAWQHVRWTVSLATVAGYLSLIEERVGRAILLFAVCVRHVALVRVAKVSALNLINGCFVHGLLCAGVQRPDDARTSLTTGIRALPDIVAAQDLMANVWVLGDMLDVTRAARQCFIALVRCNLIPDSDTVLGPRIAPGINIGLSDVKSPLRKILSAGRCAAVSAHVRRCGGE